MLSRRSRRELHEEENAGGRKQSSAEADSTTRIRVAYQCSLEGSANLSVPGTSIMPEGQVPPPCQTENALGYPPLFTRGTRLDSKWS